jgi:4-diphosphocytidyl-2-C-methyl-D-erythritol kinase
MVGEFVRMAAYNAYAKVNFYLDVKSRREDGYHTIQSVMHKISIHDVLSFRPSMGVIVESTHPDIPQDGSNLCSKAAQALMLMANPRPPGIRINIDKHIPVAAGLGGGSSDAATTLKILNKYWNLNLDEVALMKIGLDIGSDVPFCLNGVAAVATGRGETLTAFESGHPFWLVLVKPKGKLSASQVYQLWDETDCHPSRTNINEAVSAIKKGDPIALGRAVFNALEQPAICLMPEIARAKDLLIQCGCTGVAMSGSGPTVFGIVRDFNHAIQVRDVIKSYGGWDSVMITQTITTENHI